ncbi:hypothetical protein AVEN_158686-1 [Araneus ventricosus]|uniref:Uncharacterized protein n=1 Tax=Araneus ventricosus TaxID=182803 RepID=A0A4Y2P6X1_ARAVE|nr:hypothetical protein AVEN_158686-1 [Araneus ventricosus]
MLRSAVCIYEEKLLINASGAGVLLLLLVSSLPLRLSNALNPVGWAGLGWVVSHRTSGRTFDPLRMINVQQPNTRRSLVESASTLEPFGSEATTAPFQSWKTDFKNECRTRK